MRYVCSCGKRFYETYDFIPRYHRRTLRLSYKIIDILRSARSIKSVAEETNVSVTTVTRLLNTINYTASALPTCLSIVEFKGNAESSGIPEFESCAKTYMHWSRGILNAFKYGYTNGPREEFNNKIKVLKRSSYEIRSFKRFRTRIIHCPI